MTDANTNVYASETAISTQVNEIEAAYENSASYHAAATLSSLIGTNVHIESELEHDADSGTHVEMTPLTSVELESLLERDTFDWLLG